MSNSSKPTTSPQATGRARSVTSLFNGLGASLRRSSRAASAPTPPSPTQPTTEDRLQQTASSLLAAETSIPSSASPRPAGQRGPMVEFYHHRNETQHYNLITPPSPQPQLALPPPQLQLTSTSLVVPATSPQSFGQAAAEAVGETAITAITAASLGTAGSAAGSIVAGNLAESQLGVFARPAAESIGSYLGGTAGAVMGATAIRCPYRRRRNSSLPAFGPVP